MERFLNFSFLFVRLRVVARVGERVDLEACMDIMDLLYEKEVTSVLYGSPCSLAASILVHLFIFSALIKAHFTFHLDFF